jgi:hypothetical protein
VSFDDLSGVFCIRMWMRRLCFANATGTTSGQESENQNECDGFHGFIIG